MYFRYIRDLRPNENAFLKIHRNFIKILKRWYHLVTISEQTGYEFKKMREPLFDFFAFRDQTGIISWKSCRNIRISRIDSARTFLLPKVYDALKWLAASPFCPGVPSPCTRYSMTHLDSAQWVLESIRLSVERCDFAQRRILGSFTTANCNPCCCFGSNNALHSCVGT